MLQVLSRRFEVVVFQIKFLLQLVCFDLQFNPVLALGITHLEQFKLKLVVASSKHLVFIPQFSFDLLALDHLDLKPAYLLFKLTYTLCEHILAAHLLL
jgi:hypothetical protein